jgi:ATP/maltotriose-dependent transcriptional regulator MalT
MWPAFEIAAVLRHFDADALRALLDAGDADGLYAELRRWPFVRIPLEGEGLAVHDIMRDFMNEALRVRTPQRFQTLHHKAAQYYEERAQTMSGSDTERLALVPSRAGE